MRSETGKCWQSDGAVRTHTLGDTEVRFLRCASGRAADLWSDQPMTTEHADRPSDDVPMGHVPDFEVEDDRPRVITAATAETFRMHEDRNPAGYLAINVEAAVEVRR